MIFLVSGPFTLREIDPNVDSVSMSIYEELKYGSATTSFWDIPTNVADPGDVCLRKRPENFHMAAKAPDAFAMMLMFAMTAVLTGMTMLFALDFASPSFVISTTVVPSVVVA